MTEQEAQNGVAGVDDLDVAEDEQNQLPAVADHVESEASATASSSTAVPPPENAGTVARIQQQIRESHTPEDFKTLLRKRWYVIFVLFGT